MYKEIHDIERNFGFLDWALRQSEPFLMRLVTGYGATCSGITPLANRYVTTAWINHESVAGVGLSILVSPF